MPTSNSGAGYRAAGTVMMIIGGLVFAVIQAVVTATPMSTPDYVHRGLAIGSGVLVMVGVVVLALGVIRGWLLGAMIYVHGRPRRDGDEEPETEGVVSLDDVRLLKRIDRKIRGEDPPAE